MAKQLRLLLKAVRDRVAQLEDQRVALDEALGELREVEAQTHNALEALGSGRKAYDRLNNAIGVSRMKNVVIAGYARSPFTLANKGALTRVRPDDLAAQVVRALISAPASGPRTSRTSSSAARFPRPSRV